MEITAIDYLKARFGEDFNYTYHVYPRGKYEHPQYGGDISELLEEFKSLLLTKIENAVQTQNPRDKSWVVIDRETGTLAAHLDNPLPNIPKAKKK
jgi:hypothetical protein